MCGAMPLLPTGLTVRTGLTGLGAPCRDEGVPRKTVALLVGECYAAGSFACLCIIQGYLHEACKLKHGAIQKPLETGGTVGACCAAFVSAVAAFNALRRRPPAPEQAEVAASRDHDEGAAAAAAAVAVAAASAAAVATTPEAAAAATAVHKATIATDAAGAAPAAEAPSPPVNPTNQQTLKAVTAPTAAAAAAEKEEEQQQPLTPADAPPTSPAPTAAAAPTPARLPPPADSSPPHSDGTPPNDGTPLAQLHLDGLAPPDLRFGSRSSASFHKQAGPPACCFCPSFSTAGCPIALTAASASAAAGAGGAEAAAAAAAPPPGDGDGVAAALRGPACALCPQASPSVTLSPRVLSVRDCPSPRGGGAGAGASPRSPLASSPTAVAPVSPRATAVL
jgi:hypothetical protein